MALRAPVVCPHCNNAHLRDEPCAAVARIRRERKARYDAKRPNARQRGYDRQWEKLRDQHKARHPICAWPGCSKPVHSVDHIIPHKGDDRLRLDPQNLQSLCAHHHSSAKQRQERRVTRSNTNG